MKQKLSLSVIGLGKLGLPLAAFYAQKQDVYAYDKSVERMALLKSSKPNHFTEPLLQKLLKVNKQRLHTVENIAQAVEKSTVTFVVVPTPSEKNGDFSLSFVLDVLKKVGIALRTKKTYHTLVLVSTVLPGATEKYLVPMLEKWSKKTVGKELGFCYSPEFIALGDVIRNLTKPDFILIGESDAKSGTTLTSLKHSMCGEEIGVKRMSFVNAELTKIALNSYVTAKMSFANTLARMCEKLPGAHIDTVTDALGQDKRIGKHYLKGAVAYGGPCFPRDNYALSYTAKRIGIKANLQLVTHSINDAQNDFLKKLVLTYLKKGKTVGILGMSYKPDTDVIEEAPGYLLARAIYARYATYVYDPAALPVVKSNMKSKVRYAESAVELIKKSDVVVFAMMWKEFLTLPAGLFKGTDKVVIDCWRARLDLSAISTITYIPLGISFSKT